MPGGELRTSAPVPEPPETSTFSRYARLNEASAKSTPPRATVHVGSVSKHAPPQRRNDALGAAAARSANVVPGASSPEHVGGQAMPAGALETAPSPDTVSLKPEGRLPSDNEATRMSASIVSKHAGAFPLHSPAQDVTGRLSGSDVRMTSEPARKRCEQTTPQSIPGGTLTMRASEVTLREYVRRNSACTLRSPFIEIRQGLSVQSPAQPPNRNPGSASARNATERPSEKALVHARPQAIPGGPLVTTPLPTRSTVKLRGSGPSLSARTASTVVGPVTTIVQIDAAPVQAPRQLASRDPEAGSAMRSMTLPAATFCVQVVVQLESKTRTTPLPDPEIETVSGTRATARDTDRPGDGSAPAETRRTPTSVHAAYRGAGRSSRDLTRTTTPSEVDDGNVFCRLSTSAPASRTRSREHGGRVGNGKSARLRKMNRARTSRERRGDRDPRSGCSARLYPDARGGSRRKAGRSWSHAAANHAPGTLMIPTRIRSVVSTSSCTVAKTLVPTNVANATTGIPNRML